MKPAGHFTRYKLRLLLLKLYLRSGSKLIMKCILTNDFSSNPVNYFTF